MNASPIIVSYMVAHPEAWDGIKRATYAYHDDVAINLDAPHVYNAAWREATCRHCGRSREMVRWDESQSPQCANYKARRSVSAIIREEEERFERCRGRWEGLVSKVTNWDSITGEWLAHTHHTHGLDPDVLYLIGGKGGVPAELYRAYEVAYEAHKDTGRRGQKTVVVVAKTIE